MSTGDRILFNTGGMQNLRDSQDSAHGRFAGILSDIKRSRTTMMGLWHGDIGTGGYTAKANQHETNYTDLQDAFRQLINATDNSISHATSAFAKIDGIWG
jgi:uncharacterized protein YukE